MRAQTTRTRRPSTSPLTVLRHRYFATMWLASVVSDTGTWMQAITIGVLVARITGKATSTGLVTVAAFATQGLGSPIGGVMADRFDRRKMFMGALAAQTAVTVVIAIVLRASRPSVGVLATLIALQGLTGAFGQPAAQSLLPSLVPRDELLKAVSLGAVSWNSGRILGAAFAAALGIALSPSGIVVVNAITFVLLLAAVSSLRGNFKVARTGVRKRFFTEMADGARIGWRVPGCRVGLIGMIFVQLTLIVWVGLIPIVAQKQLHGTRGLASTITTVQGAGAIIGAGVSAWLVAWIGRPRALMAAAAVSTLALLGYSRATNRAQALPFVFVLGLASVGLFVSLSAILQRDAPEHSRARLMSIQSATLGVCYGTSVLIAGKLADRFGLPVVHAGAALLFGFGVALSFVFLRPYWTVVGHNDPRSRLVERRHHRQRAAVSQK